MERRAIHCPIFSFVKLIWGILVNKDYIMKRLTVFVPIIFICLSLIAQDGKLPIIDMHMHAYPAAAIGPPPTMVCRGTINFPSQQPNEDLTFAKMIECEAPLWSPTTDEEVMNRSLEIMEKYNIFGVASGPIEFVSKWKLASQKRIIPAIQVNDKGPDIQTIKAYIENGDIEIIGEIVTQLKGIAPDDSFLEPYWTLAEDLDIPVGIHVGLASPGTAYIWSEEYRASLSDPLLLEEVLLNHPNLRIYVMHSAWPMLDNLIHLLYSHPQVYTDVGLISWLLPKKEFHRYLKTIVEAGFGKRVMFGSDQMIWPETIEIALEAIESADFLSFEQKRDILYNNAARFLKLSESEIEVHHRLGLERR
jgi:predicted TIM-barrel fold metal-dependent hydrolase